MTSDHWKQKMVKGADLDGFRLRKGQWERLEDTGSIPVYSTMAETLSEKEEAQTPSLDDFFAAQPAPVTPTKPRVHISDNACISCEG